MIYTVSVEKHDFHQCFEASSFEDALAQADATGEIWVRHSVRVKPRFGDPRPFIKTELGFKGGVSWKEFHRNVMKIHR